MSSDMGTVPGAKIIKDKVHRTLHIRVNQVMQWPAGHAMTGIVARNVPQNRPTTNRMLKFEKFVPWWSKTGLQLTNNNVPVQSTREKWRQRIETFLRQAPWSVGVCDGCRGTSWRCRLFWTVLQCRHHVLDELSPPKSDTQPRKRRHDLTRPDKNYIVRLLYKKT